MKNIVLVFSLIFISVSAFSQDCEAYFPMDEGTSFETTSYDKKDKKSGRTTQKVIEKSSITGGMAAKIETVSYDKKDKESVRGEYTVKCVDNKFLFDMSVFLNQQQMEAYKDMEMEMDGDYLEFPANMKVGDKLKDGHITIIVSSSGMKVASFSVDITDRKVEAVEDVTTPAGTFSCVKISYHTFSKISFLKIEMNTTEWHAKGVGMVKSETYSNSGKYQGKTVLTKFSK